MEKNWSKVLEIIKAQLSPGNYRTWFGSVKFVTKEDGGLLIKTPSAFVKEQLSLRYLPILEAAVETTLHRKIGIEFMIDSSLEAKKQKTASEEPEEEFEFQFTPSPHAPTHYNLNPKYSLQNFVVGLSNNLAYAAAGAVVQSPGTTYNPLFIYGGTGVGKTHLMQAIGNALVAKNQNMRIVYCSTEGFTNDFITSLQTKTTRQFRDKYRMCDLLLIDDIQFISGRDSTQEEFFHTFNELSTKNTQIVITSDRPPAEMQKLESRLMSRFQGGLMVDIQNPDFDTRVAILRAKCAERGDNVAEEILTLIAASFESNARELEGKLIQIIQSCKLLNQEVNEANVRKFLGSPVRSPGTKVEYKKVISSVNQYFNIKMIDLTGPARKKELVFPRQLVMYLLYEDCQLPFERIGEILGGRDHTTIMYGVDKIKQSLSRDREIQRIMVELKQAISS